MKRISSFSCDPIHRAHLGPPANRQNIEAHIVSIAPLAPSQDVADLTVVAVGPTTMLAEETWHMWWPAVRHVDGVRRLSLDRDGPIGFVFWLDRKEVRAAPVLPNLEAVTSLHCGLDDVGGTISYVCNNEDSSEWFDPYGLDLFSAILDHFEWRTDKVGPCRLRFLERDVNGKPCSWMFDRLE
jgi:hypothetical protein